VIRGVDTVIANISRLSAAAAVTFNPTAKIVRLSAAMTIRTNKWMNTSLEEKILSPHVGMLRLWWPVIKALVHQTSVGNHNVMDLSGVQVVSIDFLVPLVTCWMTRDDRFVLRKITTEKEVILGIRGIWVDVWLRYLGSLALSHQPNDKILWASNK
jgi:hypothetical protein